MSVSERESTRREFLFAAASALAYPWLKQLLLAFKEIDSNQSLNSMFQVSDEVGVFGSGFLVIRDNGQLCMATVQHVAFSLVPDVYGYQEPTKTEMRVRGGKPIKLEEPIESFPRIVPLGKEEKVVHFPLSDNDASWVGEYIERRTIVPLEWAQESPKIGRAVVIPNIFDGTVETGRIFGKDDDDIWIQLGHEAQVCRGRSGSPVVLQGTNQVVGVTSRLLNRSAMSRAVCSDRFSAETE